jgi:7-keto-8-aminopelargonate synthetase-like enzyme
MKEPGSLQQVDKTSVLFEGRKYAYFAGCDYHRLSCHPEIIRAVQTGLKKYGLNVAASRITTGNHALYGELESALAEFFHAPAALLVSNGYATNSVVVQALRGEFTHVLLDAKAHVSLRDASQVFGCPVFEFKNRDVAQVCELIKKCGKSAKIILLTDGVYTYEGECAPLKEYLTALGARGMILLDDAHSAGVMGKTGRGTIEFEGVPRQRIIQTITLSKAFGAYGGAILCSRQLRERMIAKSSIFAGSTPLPLPLACAGLQGLGLLERDGSFLARLRQNSDYLKRGLREAGFPTSLTSVPVAAITPKGAAHAAALRKALLAEKVFPSFIIYPGGPPGGYLRMVISSAHTKKQLDALLRAVKRS